MTIYALGVRAGEHILSIQGHISNDKVTLAAGPALPAGQLLAKNATTGAYQPYDNANADAGVARAILYAPQPERAAAEQVVVTARLAEVSAGQLTGLDAAARDDLAAVFIIVR